MSPAIRDLSTLGLRFLVLNNRLDWPVVQILVDGPCVGLTVVVVIRSQWTTPTIPRSAASVRGRDEG